MSLTLQAGNEFVLNDASSVVSQLNINKTSYVLFLDYTKGSETNLKLNISFNFGTDTTDRYISIDNSGAITKWEKTLSASGNYVFVVDLPVCVGIIKVTVTPTGSATGTLIIGGTPDSK